MESMDLIKNRIISLAEKKDDFAEEQARSYMNELLSKLDYWKSCEKIEIL